MCTLGGVYCTNLAMKNLAIKDNAHGRRGEADDEESEKEHEECASLLHWMHGNRKSVGTMGMTL